MMDGPDFDARLGAAIREARLDAGYTQEEIARALRVTPATIARYELGIRHLSVGTLLQIAAALEMPLSRLVPGAEQLERTATLTLAESPLQQAVQTLVRVLEEHPDLMPKVLETVQTALSDERRYTDAAMSTEGRSLNEREGNDAYTSNAHVIAVANLKGGVGKTTTVLNLAGFAGRMGKRVLAIDTDPQGSLSRSALPDDAPGVSLSDAFSRRARSLDGVRVPSRFPGVDLVPSTLALEAVLQTAIPWEGREYVLLDMLTPHLEEYDLVLIDCRPGVDLSVTNALTAARWLLVPVECSFLALDGYEHVHALQRRLNQRINPDLELLGLLPTRYRSGTAHGQAALEEIEQQVAAAQPPLRFAPIRMAIAAADAPAQGMTLAQFAPNSPIGQEYHAVTDQIIVFLEGRA